MGVGVTRAAREDYRADKRSGALRNRRKASPIMNNCIATAAVTLLATVFPISMAGAQNLGIGLSSSGSNVVAIAGTNVQVVPIPATPLAANGAHYTSASGPAQTAYSSFNWTQAASTSSAEIILTAQSSVQGNASATAGPVDVVVLLSYPTPTTVRLYASATRETVPGSPMPTARMDIHDDGVFEMIGAPSNVFYPIVLGPVPTPVRCQLATDLSTDGNATAEVHLQLVTGETAISPLASGCQTGFYWLQPRFDGGLDFGTVPGAAGSVFSVFGLATQPLYLGNYASPGSPVVLPCSLLPTPDLVTFLPTSATQVLVVPPAARPITMFSQAVRIVAGGLVTSDATYIQAY